MMSRAALRADPCAYCLNVGGTVDHIEPRSRGGLDVPNNRTGACPRCNCQKGETPLLLFLVRRGFPVKPYPFDRFRLSLRRRRKVARAFRRLDAIERAAKQDAASENAA